MAVKIMTFFKTHIPNIYACRTCLMSSLTSQSTSNYHARKYGVRAAMPGFIAKKLCPNLVIVPTNFDKYRAVSNEVRVMEKTHK